MSPTELTSLVPWWTPWPSVGPGADLLGDLTRQRVIEIGCGRGDNAAALAIAGGIVTAIDADPAKMHHARQRWAGTPRLTFTHDDAATYLAHTRRTYDVAVSIFGALSFAGPDLLDHIARRLRTSGTLAVSVRLGGNAYARSADDWASLVALYGFTINKRLTCPHPTNPSDPPCLVFVAHCNRGAP